jgi:hypothetical protein
LAASFYNNVQKSWCYSTYASDDPAVQVIGEKEDDLMLLLKVGYFVVQCQLLFLYSALLMFNVRQCCAGDWG